MSSRREAARPNAGPATAALASAARPGAGPARRRLIAAGQRAGLAALAAVWLLPLGAALVTSLRPLDDITLRGFWTWPGEVSLDNYAVAWRAGLARYLANSLIITLPALLAMLLLSSLSAYALARHRFRGSFLIYALYAGGAMLPYQALMLPVFRLASLLGLYDTYLALILVHTAFQLGFCTFVLRNFMRTVPHEVLDAARVDGCGELGLYTRIVLPLTVPALAALATLEFTWVFNDYLWALILLRSDSLRPVTAGLATLRGEYVTDWPVLVAGALLAAAPTLAVFALLQRWFVRGLLFGSGQG